MTRWLALLALPLLAGCGDKELTKTTDPEAIKREQEKLNAPMPGSNENRGSLKDNAIKREQDARRRGGP